MKVLDYSYMQTQKNQNCIITEDVNGHRRTIKAKYRMNILVILKGN
jgi:hypothetical protein